MHDRVNIGIHNFHLIRNHMGFFPYLIKSRKPRSDQPVQAVVETIPVPVPGCALPPRHVVHLEDPGLKPVKLSVNTC